MLLDESMPYISQLSFAEKIIVFDTIFTWLLRVFPDMDANYGKPFYENLLIYSNFLCLGDICWATFLIIGMNKGGSIHWNICSTLFLNQYKY